MNPTIIDALPGSVVATSTSSGLLLPRRNRRVYAYVQNADASIAIKVAVSQAVLDAGGGISLPATKIYRHDGRSPLYAKAASGTPNMNVLEFIGSGGEGKLADSSTVSVTGLATLILPRDPKRVKATIRNNDGSKRLTIGHSSNLADQSNGILLAAAEFINVYGEAPIWGLTNPTNEVQTITYASQPDAGSYKLRIFWSDGSIETTGAIAFGAAASAIDTALELLTHIGSGGVTVSGTTGQGPFTVTFGGTLVANKNIPTMTVVESTLQASSADVAITIGTTTQGASGAATVGFDAVYKS